MSTSLLPPISERPQREGFRRASRASLREHQLGRLQRLLGRVLPGNAYYADKFRGLSWNIQSLEEWTQFPTSIKSDWLPKGDATHWARHHTHGIEGYQRAHRTSGTRGHPMVIMDTAEDWRWWLESWQYVLDVAEVTARDRVFMAFSFGPFIGFWSAHDACLARGAMVVPAGGMTSLARLQWLESMRASVVCCTPSYALHLAEVARQQGMDLAGGSTDRLIVAGEPGGSIPEIRKRIEYEWGARVIDHAGATEVGAWSYGTEAGDGLEIIESEFIAEFLPLENVARFETPASTRPASMLGEEPKELVLTALGRVGAPVLRYRTGDVVVPYWNADQQGFVRLLGGICGRADDMLIVRGVNVFPSSIEAILRGFPEVAEYRMTVTRQGALDQVRVEVEDGLRDPARIARALESRLGLRIDVHIAPSGSLPRFEAKAQRMVDLRHL